ncbi:MAG: helix-turn-helix domain-containing protein [Lentisphaeria bacterium]|nr:helix-turn-helix domain-containing protein [Lentisphaeria bacterium]
MLFSDLPPDEAAMKMRQLWLTLEKAFNARLTLHDHAGAFTLPDGVKLLPGKNLHRAPCCLFWYGARERCNDHCSFGAKREAGTAKAAFVSTCFCGVTELVMPLFIGSVHAATIFAGAYRKKDFDVSAFPQRYRKVYGELPVWNEARRPELEALLLSAGYALLHLADALRSRYSVEQGRSGRIRRFFRSRFSENVGVADLAADLELSESRTEHILLETFGRGFSELLRAERLRQVEKQLDESDLPLKKIARMTGFSSEYYLSTVFKKTHGIPPGVWRRERQKKGGTVPQ